MKRNSHPGSLAVREHLISGHPITQLEALSVFGVSWLTKLISQLKREGHNIQRDSISYLKVKTRMNRHMLITPPPNLPLKEIEFTEWWIQQ